MLADFWREITNTIRQADKPVELRTGDPRVVTFFMPNGETVDYEKPTPSLKGFAQSLSSFIDLVNDEGVCPAPEVHVGSPGGVTVAPHRHELWRPKVGLELNSTDQWTQLVKLSTGTKFDVRGLVRWLRFEMPGSSPQLQKDFARIDFSRKSDGKRSVEFGSESMGRSVEATVQQADKIPEAFRITTPICATEGCRILADVEVRVWLDMENERVELKTNPDSLRLAEAGVMREIAETITAQTSCPVRMFTEGRVRGLRHDDDNPF